MGRIYRRGDTWHAYWTDPAGQPQRRSLRTQDKTVARARLRELELASTNPAAYSGHTLGEAVDALERAMAGSPKGTKECYSERARHLIRLLGDDTRLATLTRDRATWYIAERIREGAHPSTVGKECVVLRRALTEAAERKLWVGEARAIVPSVKTRYQPRDRWLTREEAASLLAALPAHRRLWAALAIYAGLRDSEVTLLRWEHVDLERGVLRAPGRKTEGAWRRIPIAADLAPMLAAVADKAGTVVEEWPNVRRDLRVAMTQAIEGFPRRRLPAGNIHPPIPDAAKISPNDLRRTFASWLVQAGVSHLVVAHLLGHGSTRMVERVYGRLDETTYRRAVDALCSPCASTGSKQAGRAAGAKRKTA